MKHLRIKRGVKAATFPDIKTFMHAYTRVFGDQFVYCQADNEPGKLYSAEELYKEIKICFVSSYETQRQWAVSALSCFSL